MKKNISLSAEQRAAHRKLLNDEQRHYIDEKLKRSRRTAFANAIAQAKGSGSEDYQNWTMVSYIDVGPDYKTAQEPLKCDCGKVLRYQYTLMHTETGEYKRYGVSHLKEHLGMPDAIVSEVVRGIQNIDYELDELLVKIKSGWQSPIDLSQFEDLPLDILEATALGLPLLDTQVARLKHLLRSPLNTSNKEKKKLERSVLDGRFKASVDSILKVRSLSALDICEQLSESFGYSDALINGRPETYGNVVVYMESLCAKGLWIKKNGIYQFKGGTK